MSPDQNGNRERSGRSADRKARLEQELRANLVKRKARMRASVAGPQETGATEEMGEILPEAVGGDIEPI